MGPIARSVACSFAVLLLLFIHPAGSPAQSPAAGGTGPAPAGTARAEEFRSIDEYRASILSRAYATVFSVIDAGDAPDDSLEDGIFFPQTLRSAIQNANLTPGPHLIDLNPALPAVLQPSNQLPVLAQSITLVGHGKFLDGSLAPANASGLFVTGNGCLITDIQIRRWGNSGIALQGSNDTIKGVGITEIDGPGINLNFANNNVIGGKGIYIRNTIGHLTGPGGTGISVILGSAGNLIEGNLIGNDGVDSLPNSRYGIVIQGPDNIVRANTISGNAYGGIELNHANSHGNVIEDNRIGTDFTGMLAVPFQDYAVSLLESADDTVRRNVISGGNNRGISISGAVSGTWIADNFIGVDTTGADTLTNDGAGITTSGTGVTIVNNTLSGNFTGIAVFSGACVVKGNMIGTDITGTKRLGNTYHGIQLSGSGHVIGGLLASERNVISGNPGSGIYSTSGTGSLVEGNYIGTDVTGTKAIPNGEGIAALQNTRGLVVSANVISGNDSDGVRIGKIFTQTPYGVVVRGNTIGLAANGQDTLPNGRHGIFANITHHDTIGGGDDLDANTIGSNRGYGIHLRGDSTHHIAVWNNVVGTGFGGVPRPNLAGIVIDSARDNAIGDAPWADPGNLVASNAGTGVAVLNGATGNSIRFNAIHDNGGGGIDLEWDGISPNDDADADSGANGLLNFPVVKVVTADSMIRVIGEYRGAPGQPYSLDFYTNEACDPSGNGEGATYIGTGDVVTDTTGFATFGFAFPFAPGNVVTAAATDTLNNTSEFSACASALPPGLYAEIGVEVADTVLAAAPGDTIGFRIRVVNNGPDPAVGVRVVDTLFALVHLRDSVTSGSTTVSGDTLTWDLGLLPPGNEATLVLHAIADTGDTAFCRVFAASFTPDPWPANNFDADTTILGPATGVGPGDAGAVPTAFRLEQNFPNPFNPSTEIGFELPSGGRVTLTVYDVLGREVGRPADGQYPAGRHSVVWEAASLQSGVYFYRMAAGSWVATGKMVLVR